MKSHVQVAVIGGGVTGCSILYHLTKLGVKDAVLLERSELTAGSTWHAAGGCFALGDANNISLLQKYGIELYPELEKETGQSCGLHMVGGLHIARSRDRWDGLKLLKSKARRSGIPVREVGPDEIRELVPFFNLEGLEGALYDPVRGHVDPSGVTQAFARGARRGGAEIYRQTALLETRALPDGGWELVTPQGTIKAEVVVNAAGLWAREVAAQAGITLPLMPVEHHYIVTERIEEVAALTREIPLIGDADAGYYMRQEGQGLLLGCYEATCHHWAETGTPLDFGHELLPDDLERIEVNMAQACHCIPPLAEAGIKRVVNGPMIFSPDLMPLLGPYPGLPTYFCAAGVMAGFSQGPGVGKLLAEWIVEGEPSMDIMAWDVTRFGDYADAAYTKARTGYHYTTRFHLHFPYEELAAGRPNRTTPVYDELKAAGAVFGEAFGLEFPLWYAREGEAAEDKPAYQRANWFEPVGEECRALRRSVGLIEISSFGKYEVTGPGAAGWLNLMLANRMPRETGRSVLSPMLNTRGRLIGDYTVTRLGPERFLIVGSGTAERFHMRWFDKHLPDAGVAIRPYPLCGFNIAGPRARDLLATLTDQDVSNEAFGFLRARVMPLGPVPEAIVIRISFTGELGYEIYVAAEHQLALFQAIREAGRAFDLALVGSRALLSLRLEKGFPSWGRELSPDFTPFDCGLERFVKLDKEDFIGRPAALSAQQAGADYGLALLTVEADNVDAWGGEPVLRDGELVGYVTSGAYGHTVNKSLALAALSCQAIDEDADYVVEVLGVPRAARLSRQPLVDPEGARMRG